MCDHAMMTWRACVPVGSSPMSAVDSQALIVSRRRIPVPSYHWMWM